MILVAAACVVGALWVLVVVPWWESRAERARAARAECERYGHRWGRIFAACHNPDWPVRHCERCGLQENLTRCPMCDRAISEGRPVA